MIYQFKQAVILSLLFLTGCAGVKVGSGETVDLYLDSGWKIIQYERYPHTDMVTKIQYGRTNQQRDGFDTVRIVAYGKQIPMKNYLEKLVVSLAPECPGMMKPSIIFQNEKGFLLESLVSPCNDSLGSLENITGVVKHELLRAIDGKEQRFLITYSLPNYMLPFDKKADLVKKLTNARVIVK